jgi:hypothetical protein
MRQPLEIGADPWPAPPRTGSREQNSSPCFSKNVSYGVNDAARLRPDSIVNMAAGVTLGQESHLPSEHLPFRSELLRRIPKAGRFD